MPEVSVHRKASTRQVHTAQFMAELHKKAVSRTVVTKGWGRDGGDTGQMVEKFI